MGAAGGAKASNTTFGQSLSAPGGSRAVRGGSTVTNTPTPIGPTNAATGTLATALSPTTISSTSSNLMFPSDLISGVGDRNYYITLQFLKYQRRSIFTQPFLSTTGGIRLPIPNNLVDRQDVTFGEEDAPTVGAGIEGTLAAMQGNSAAKSAIIGGVATAAKIAQNTAESMLSGITGGSTPTNQVLQMAGYAQNPFLTVLFKAPAFKTHSFQWKLSPQDETESNTLRDIIKNIRKNMLPGKTNATGGTLLTYPNMVQIQLSPSEEYLYKFKPAVIESMSVNFAPSYQPSFFKTTKAPTEVTLTLQIKEIEYWLTEDVE